MFEIDPTIYPHLDAIASDRDRQQRLRKQASEAYVRKLERNVSVYRALAAGALAYAVAVTALSLATGAWHLC